MSIPRTQGSRRLQALFQKADGPVFALDAAELKHKVPKGLVVEGPLYLR